MTKQTSTPGAGVVANMNTAWLIAGGPSLKGISLRLLRTKWVVAVNRAHELVPEAERLDIYWSDWRFWGEYKNILVERQFNDDKIHLHSCPDIAGRPYPSIVRLWQASGRSGIDPRQGGINHGNNSGYAAINVAYHLGAKRMLLLGYDMKLDEDGSGHWHEEYPWGDMRARTLQEKMLPNYQSLAEDLLVLGVTVINCNPDSALEFFPKIALSDLPGFIP